MEKRKVMSCALVFALTICFMLIGTAGVHAASNGCKTLVKTKTVSIKPGKTYKTPVFKLTKKMAFQIPVEIWLSPKDKKKPDYIKKGGYKVTLKTAKGKKKGSFSQSLKGYGYRETDSSYYDWWYFYDNTLEDPGFAKGKYYFAIKNTTNRIIKVRYSVRGYTEIASKADFPDEFTAESGMEYYIGEIGPGIPLIEDVECDNPAIDISWWMITYNGAIYMAPSIESKSETGVLSIKLINNPEPFKIKLTVNDEYWEEEEEE